MASPFQQVQASLKSWSPARLFPAVGLWIDPSDISTMFQDAAGTTPVTASGQSVGLIRDKSGNGYHLSQSTSGKRPTFQEDGNGKRSLLFDGTDDYLASPSFASTFTQPNTICLAFKVTSVPPTSTSWYMFGSNEGGTSQQILQVTDTVLAYYAGTFRNSSKSTDTNPHVGTMLFNGASSSFRIDAASVSTANPGSNSLSSLLFGSSSALSTAANASLYGLVVLDSSLGSNQALLETWMGKKCGVTI